MGLSRVVWLSLVVHGQNTKTLALEVVDAPAPPPPPHTHLFGLQEHVAEKGYPGGGGGVVLTQKAVAVTSLTC